MKKKYNLSMVLAVATLFFGGCSDFYQNDNNVENVEVDSVNEEIEDFSLVKNESLDDEADILAENEVELSNLLVDNINNSSTRTGMSISGLSSNNGSSSNSGSSSNNGSSSSSGSSSNNGSSSNSGSTTPSNPTPPVVEEPKPQKPVDILDWNYIKSTLIAKGQNLGMIYEPSMNRELDGYASPWQSSYMPVNNEDVIGYIGYQMEQAASWGRTYFNLEMVVQADGNVLIYLIR